MSSKAFKKVNFTQVSKLTSGKITRSVVKVTSKTNKADIDVDVLQGLVEGLEKQAKEEGENIQIKICALNNQRWFTMKRLDSELNVEDFEDYYRNTVANIAKFEKFAQLEVTIIRQKKNLFL